jgi:hypothetical protein
MMESGWVARARTPGRARRASALPRVHQFIKARLPTRSLALNLGGIVKTNYTLGHLEEARLVFFPEKSMLATVAAAVCPRGIFARTGLRLTLLVSRAQPYRGLLTTIA